MTGDCFLPSGRFKVGTFRFTRLCSWIFIGYPAGFQWVTYDRGWIHDKSPPILLMPEEWQ